MNQPIKVLAISASPRKHGNSYFLMEQVLRCAESQKYDVQVKRISLGEKRVGPCIGCLACYKNGGRCILKDSFEEVRELWKEADCILYFTPVYVAGIPGQLKCFIDRLSNADYGLAIRGARHLKTIGVISQGGDFFGGGAELCMIDIMRHTAMMNCVYIPPDASYIGAGGWVWDSHAHAMEEKAEMNTPDYQKTLEIAQNILKRAVETSAIIKSGALVQKEVLKKDASYQYFYDRQEKGGMEGWN